MILMMMRMPCQPSIMCGEIKSSKGSYEDWSGSQLGRGDANIRQGSAHPQ